MNFMTQEYWRKISLRLKLRQSSGDDFQNFFSDVMEKLHGDDFVRIRPFGQRGDKGCDGYLQSTGQLFQCYGAVGGGKSKVDYLIGKMEDDFAKANQNLGAIMKEWHMVHNLVDGLPIEAVQTLEKLRDENPDIGFGFIGLEGFEQRINDLDKAQIEEILGPAATNQDSQNLQVAELRDLINGVIAETEKSDPKLEDIAPVPADKLDANDLPEYWKSLISSGWQNAHVVAAYIDRHPDPLVGETIPELPQVVVLDVVDFGGRIAPVPCDDPFHRQFDAVPIIEQNWIDQEMSLMVVFIAGLDERRSRTHVATPDMHVPRNLVV